MRTPPALSVGPALRAGLRCFAIIAIALLLPAVAAPLTYQLNERIESNTQGGWDKATIIEVGKPGTAHEGEYKVHYDGYAASYDRWLQPVYFRKVAGGAPVVPPLPIPGTTPSASPAPARAGDSSVAPRLGKYNINSYGAVGKPPLYLGHIELLAGGRYRISRRSSGEYYGEGTYAFDDAGSAVQWLSGPCKDEGWSGTFANERDGKTHKIRLRTTTIATNSTD